MSRRNSGTVVGVGAAACVACCAGPLLAFFGAIGLGTVLGVFLFGAAGLIVAALAIVPVVRGTQRAASRTAADSIPVETPRLQTKA
jgi:hypothetical protein